jgi:hypothetical protein
MPYLLCAEGDREHDAMTGSRHIADTAPIDNDRRDSGPWRRDRSTRELGKGESVSAFPRHFREQLTARDYCCGRQYFQLEKPHMSVDGARPPVGLPSPSSVPGKT